MHRDKVFLTADVRLGIQYAREHAGDAGYLYEVEVDMAAAVPLLDSRRAHGRRQTIKSNTAIYVADSAVCRVIARWKTERLGRHRGYSIVEG